MECPKLPSNELQRSDAVIQYALMDTLPEEDYDNITKLAADICQVPISLITMIDNNRNFFKSHHGISFQESPRDISFCGHAILSEQSIFVIEDARKDPRFTDNPFIESAGAIFYAGVPLINPEGYALGTLCVFDHAPKVLSDHQQEALIILGKQVVNLLELRRKNIILENAKKQLQQHNYELGKFASHVSHDLKSPLANIVSLTRLLKDDLKEQLSPDTLIYFDHIEESTSILRDYIDGILLHYKADELLVAKKEEVNFYELAEDLKQLLFSKNDLLLVSGQEFIHNINKPALTQILINLIDNALKYNESTKKIIQISYIDEPGFHKFAVSDNGIGIPKNKQEIIFQLFTTLPKPDGKPSTGIGLSTIKNLIHKLGGSITVVSDLGQGSVFTFTIAK